MTTAVVLFRKHFLGTLPDYPIIATLIPEQDRYWRQNSAESVLKFPTAVAFSSKNILLFICDKKKSTIFMANLHNPVCAIPIAGSLSQALGSWERKKGEREKKCPKSRNLYSSR